MAPDTPTERYSESSLNYVNSPLFQQIIAQILSGDVDPRKVDWRDVVSRAENASEWQISITNQTEATESEAFNWGLFLPLFVSGLFMLLIVFCLFKHAWQRRCLPGRQRSFGSLFRGGAQPYIDNVRNSTRSTCALQRGDDDRTSMRSAYSQAKQPAIFFTKVSRLGSISESPEEYYAKYSVPRKISLAESMTPKTPDSQSSLSSLFSRITVDAHNILSNSAMYPTSDKTIDKFSTLAHSFPNLQVLPAQSPLPSVPYHLTWITPLSAQSEPVLVDHMTATTLQRRLFAHLEKKVHNTVLNDAKLACDVIDDLSKSTNKSPFYPNNNTPTSGSVEPLPPDVIINRTHTAAPQQTSSRNYNGKLEHTVSKHDDERTVQQITSVHGQ